MKVELVGLEKDEWPWRDIGGWLHVGWGWWWGKQTRLRWPPLLWPEPVVDGGTIHWTGNRRKCSWGQAEIREDDEIIGSELNTLWYNFGSFWSWHSLFLYFPWKLETSMTFPRNHGAESPKIFVEIGRSGWRRDDTQWYNFGSLLQRLTKTIQPLILSPSTPGNGSFAGKPSCIIIMGFSISIMGDI